MEKDRTKVIEEVLEEFKNMETNYGQKVMQLHTGSPGKDTLKTCSDMLLKATQDVLHVDTDVGDVFKYGETQGDDEFRKELAKFLSSEYGDQVESSRLMVTAGATQGLHLLLTILFSTNSLVFIEDPSYFFALRMIQDDLRMNLIPVQTDEEGLKTDDWERLLQEHLKDNQPEENRRFSACLYVVPVYNNPTGFCYSSGRCQDLVRLARQYNVLVIAEDVYNLLHYRNAVAAPKRLLAYDVPSDPDFCGGHVLSNTTFSKILAPSVRLGWIEGPESLISIVHDSSMMWSGGNPNHYMSKLVTCLLRSGEQARHVAWLRRTYKERMHALSNVLKDQLPDGCSFIEPEGGFFLWLKFRPETDAFHFLKYLTEHYRVSFLPGICTSATIGFKDCARLSICGSDVTTVEEAARRLCEAYKVYLNDQIKHD